VLVFDDADIGRAAKMLAKFKIRNAGQVCVSPTRFYVQEKAYDQFLEAFVGTLKSVKVGDGLDPDTQMGPLAHERRVPTMTKFVENAVERGGKVVLGGEALDRAGHFFAPTVITDLPEDSMLMTEEPFGPLAPITRFSDTDDVIRRANSLPFGLSSYVFTTSLQTATKVSNNLESGMVNINHFGSALPETPFGGVKDSGIGSEGGAETFEGYLVTKFVTHV
jgi:succinate-semialdehyde dehydrogenase/glutarate-semialdehyde dehydrogenase